MQNIIYKIAPLMLLFFTVSVFGQKQSDNFYYYKGEKFFLNINTRTISISFEGENSINSFKSLRSNSIKIKEIVEDNSRATVVSLDAKAISKKAVKSYYMEVSTSKNMTIEDYYKEIESYKKLPNTLMASPTYITKSGGELGLSNNFYVKLKDKNDIDILYKKAKEMNLEVLGHDKYMPLWFTLSVTSKNKLNSIQLANIFYETGWFESTEPAFMYHNIETSNDTYFNNQWSLNNTGQNGGTVGIDINMEQAWAITTGDPSIKTAVYDHGLEMNHPDLQANVHGTGFDANNGTSPATVRGSHGTACAGIIGAVKDNNLGISGVAPTSKLISISINLRSSDTPSQLASGFNWAWQNGADVISNSWGGYAPSSIIDNAITNTFTNGRGGKGCVIVFAAGNENNTNIRYPGNSNPDLLIVGAMSPCAERKNPNSCDGESQWGSCYGSQLDIVAPGVKMPTTDRQGANGYSTSDYTQTFNGTSSACPVVAGVAALILSVNPNLTYSEVNNIIEQSAQKVGTYTYANAGGRPNGTWNNQMGYGLVDAHQAVLLAQNGSGSDSEAPTAPSNLVSTGKTKTSVSLSWTASTDNVGVTAYDVYNGSNLSTTVNGTTATISGLTPNTSYDFTIKAKDAAGNVSGASNVLTVTTDPNNGGGTPPTYCAAEATNGPEHIARVKFGTIDNSSARDSYHDYTNISTDVAKNNSYALSVVIGQPYGNDNEVTAWIDWNIDGDFEDAGEQYLLSKSSTSEASISIPGPSGASIGTTGMRIRVSYNSSSRTPCGTRNYGEVEDYAVNIKGSKSGLITESIDDMLIYPNPTPEQFVISSKLIGAQITLINSNGVIVKKEKMTSSKTKVDLSGLPSGFYQVQLILGAKKLSKTVVIE
ncbi:S8 family serine peptidase [Aquimarina macrocephali]|uniref:S8 family serine peptidase n=1 Tax=Aquimarina macrocephali TaxID=666563 RepID=UPI0004671739|nr:S8 family serine peptidase [Aquimarina macrocephali]